MGRRSVITRQDFEREYDRVVLETIINSKDKNEKDYLIRYLMFLEKCLHSYSKGDL